MCATPVSPPILASPPTLPVPSLPAGNALGLIGVGTGLAATLGAVSQTSGDPMVLAQVRLLSLHVNSLVQACWCRCAGAGALCWVCLRALFGAAVVVGQALPLCQCFGVASLVLQAHTYSTAPAAPNRAHPLPPAASLARSWAPWALVAPLARPSPRRWPSPTCRRW